MISNYGTARRAGGERPVKADERLFTVTEVAGKLRVYRASVYDLIHTGQLTAVQVAGPRSWRVPESALEAYLASRTNG